MSEQLFIYGSLLDPATQKHVLGRYDEGDPDTLEGHKKIPAFVDGQQYSTVIPDKKNSVDGCILIVTKKELEKIDMYEEPEYIRQKITLKSGVKAWIYIYGNEKSEGAWV